MNQRILALEPYPMVELARRKKELVARGMQVFDFGTGDPIEPTPGFIVEAYKNAVPAISQYPSVAGEPPVRRAFAAWYERRFGVRLDPDSEVLPSRGSKEAIFHLPLVLVDRGAERRGVVYPVPGYPVMEIGTLYAEAESWAYMLNADNRYLMEPDRVPAEVLAKASIVWLNYPHNPTGQDLPASLWQAWCVARRQYGFVLCSDECYTELYHGDRPRSLLEFEREGCLIFHSLSKRSGMTGYRCGMIAGDSKLIALYRSCRASFGLALPVPEQAASTAAWSEESHVDERRRIFGEKRGIMTEGLRHKGIEIFPATSTFYLRCRVPAGQTDEGYAGALLDRGIVVSPGSFFGPGNEQWIRLALVPAVADCTAALARW
jgi:succinyldiaminopimelate transaminase